MPNYIGRGARDSNVGAPPPGPDLIITAISMSPASPTVGDHVVFSATIQNIGGVATPAGAILDCSFTVDGGGPSTWSDTYTTALQPNASVVITANGGTTGVNYWTATSGQHIVYGFVNTVNRITETTRANNTFEVPFGTVAASSVPNPPVLTSATPSNNRVDLVFTKPFDGGSPITAFGIFRTGGGDSGGIGFAGANATTYPDTTALNGTPYTFTVTAQNANGASAPSNARTATPFTSGSGVPADISTGQAGNKIHLWTSPQDQTMGAAIRQAWKARGASGFSMGDPYFVGFGGASRWIGGPAPAGSQYGTQRGLESGPSSVAAYHADGLEVALAVKCHSPDAPPGAWRWSDRINPPGTTPPDYSTKNPLFDVPMRTDLASKFQEWAAAAQYLGVDFLTMDWEGKGGLGSLAASTGNLNTGGYYTPADGHTLATAQAGAYATGLAIGQGLAAGWPGYKMVCYYGYPPDGWFEWVQHIVNGFPLYPAAASQYHIGVWQTIRGILDAGGYSWWQYFDHTFYKTTHIGSASFATAMKWNTEACAASLSQYLSPAGWQYGASRIYMKPFVWIDEHVGGSSDPAKDILGNREGEGSFARDRGGPSVAAQLAAFRLNAPTGASAHVGNFMYASPAIVGVTNSLEVGYLVRASDGMGRTQGGRVAADLATFNQDGYAFTGVRSDGPNPGGSISAAGSHLPGILAASQPGVVDSTLPTLTNIPAPSRAGNTVTFTGIRISHPKGVHRLEGWVLNNPNKFYATMVWDKGGGAYNTGIPNSAQVCTISIPNAPPGTTIVLASVSGQGQKKHVPVNV